MELCELTKALVDIESVTGNERACAEFVSQRLAARGFDVEHMPVSDEGPGGRANVFATCGTPEVVLSTHLDTVPPFFPVREDAEFIYGRGSCDAKGIIASQVVAAERLCAEGVRDFGLLFLVGEETVSDGARAANERPRGAKYLINGEPTENRLAVGSKGILRLDVRARGRMAHSAYPQFGESAIEKLLDILAEVRRVPLPTDPVLGPATVNIGVISGGRAANVIPDEAQAQILFRTVNGASGLRRELERIVQGRCDYEFVRETPALHMEKLDGFETDVVAFTTDLPSLGRWGRPLLLGPGSIRVAHTENECVRKADLVHAVDLYCRLVRELKAREAA
jgi:acetylornithine deacetylase